MPNLKNFYNQRAEQLGQSELLKQVGHSLNGKSISASEYQRIIDDIHFGLGLQPDDVLLDLCCGNGVITQAFSGHCRQIYGVDLSDQLIAIAKHNNQHRHVTFIQGDVMDLSRHCDGVKFSKVLMFGALQHFKPRQINQLLDLIIDECTEEFSMFFGFVTNKKQRWNFYDTFSKRIKHYYRRITDTEFMGYWWDKSGIEKVCRDRHLSCQFIELKPGQYGHPFRFHVVIKRGG